jgi:hypothetical protein
MFALSKVGKNYSFLRHTVPLKTTTMIYRVEYILFAV